MLSSPELALPCSPVVERAVSILLISWAEERGLE